MSCRSPATMRRANGNSDSFQNRESTYPVLVTTSKLLTTGIDVPTCKLIVLDANINSMTEFKLIIGRANPLIPGFREILFHHC